MNEELANKLIALTGLMRSLDACARDLEEARELLEARRATPRDRRLDYHRRLLERTTTWN